MPDAMAEVLSARLQSLERRQRLLMVIIAVFGFLLVWHEVAPRATLRAQNFTLVDEHGRQRGIWRVRDAVSKLILQNSQGTWKAVVSVDDNGGTLELYGPGEESSIRLTATGDTPRLELRNAATAEAPAGRKLNGVPLIELAGPANRIRWIRTAAAKDEER